MLNIVLSRQSFILIFFLLGLFTITLAQTHANHNYVTRYNQSQIIDSSDAAILYRRLMKVLEEDYIQLKNLGYDVQGWNEEYFESGQLMHISYYKDGRVVLFKNFYESGQCQHYITYTDSSVCNIENYFEDGALKHQLNYVNGEPKKLTEFYQNGLPKILIEYDSKLARVSSKKLWYRNAEIQEEIKLKDTLAGKYSNILYYPNGQLKEEGELQYLPETKEYINIGTRTSYESNGKKKHSTKYHFNRN